MARQTTLLAVVGGITILLLGREVHAGTVVSGSRAALQVAVSPHAGIGVWIGGPIVAGGCYPPVHREVIVTHPWRPRIARPWYPHREVVAVHPPTVRHVVVDPAPRVVVTWPPVVVEEGTVTIWITNSNGSKTSVQLTRHGSCYVGPRSEWYTTMPTNEQLRAAYGF
jgi:hypothetical protein